MQSTEHGLMPKTIKLRKQRSVRARNLSITCQSVHVLKFVRLLRLLVCFSKYIFPFSLITIVHSTRCSESRMPDDHVVRCARIPSSFRWNSFSRLHELNDLIYLYSTMFICFILSAMPLARALYTAAHFRWRTLVNS